MLSKGNHIHLMCYEKIENYADCEKIISLPYFSLKRVSDVEKLFEIIRDEKYDVIINSNSRIMALLSPYINNNTIIITISHSLRYTESDVSAFNAKYVDGIVALSNYNKDYLERKFSIKDENKIKVIYNFVLPIENADELRAAKKNSDEITIVYAGGTASSKSPELVIKILNRLIDTDLKFRFYFLGVKTPPLKKIQPFKNIESVIKKDKRVIMPGKVPSSEAKEIIAKANIFLSPSRREGCPMALIEALRVGTIPIVADYKIANRELIKDGVNGFVIGHTDTDAFVERIEDIIREPSNYQFIYDNSYRLYTELLTYEVWYNKITEFFNSNLSTHEERLNGFSAKRYRLDNYRFILMDFFNKIHLFFHESLPAAIPIMLMYIKRQK